MMFDDFVCISVLLLPALEEAANVRTLSPD
jgi:hypothetical protein